MWVTRYTTIDGCVRWFRIWVEHYIAPVVRGMPSLGPCAKIAVLTAPLAVLNVPTVRPAGEQFDDHIRRYTGSAVPVAQPADRAIGGYASGVGGAVRPSPVDVVYGTQPTLAQWPGGGTYNPNGLLPGTGVWPTLPMLPPVGRPEPGTPPSPPVGTPTPVPPDVILPPPDVVLPPNPPQDVPEPSTVLIFLLFVFIAGLFRRGTK